MARSTDGINMGKNKAKRKPKTELQQFESVMAKLKNRMNKDARIQKIVEKGKDKDEKGKAKQG